MSRLTAADRKSIPATQFGLPGQRKYPMPDKAHAADAKGRATQQEKRGAITPGQKAQIDTKANRVLGSSSLAKQRYGQ